MDDADRHHALAERAAHDRGDRFHVLEHLVDHLDDLTSRELGELVDARLVLSHGVGAPRDKWLAFWLALAGLASEVLSAEHLTSADEAALDARAVETIREVWAPMRDRALQAGAGEDLRDGDGSIGAIAEAASRAVYSTWGAQAAPDGALAALSAAAHLLLAGQALNARKLANLARNLVHAWTREAAGGTADTLDAPEDARRP
jgi:hypothetical protein